jgi:hypothetical protein
MGSACMDLWLGMSSSFGMGKKWNNFKNRIDKRALKQKIMGQFSLYS